MGGAEVCARDGWLVLYLPNSAANKRIDRPSLSEQFHRYLRQQFRTRIPSHNASGKARKVHQFTVLLPSDFVWR